MRWPASTSVGRRLSALARRAAPQNKERRSKMRRGDGVSGGCPSGSSPSGPSVHPRKGSKTRRGSPAEAQLQKKRKQNSPSGVPRDSLPTEADAASHNKQDRAKTQKEDARGSALPNVFCCAGPGYTAGYWAEPRLTVVAGRNFGSWLAQRLLSCSFLVTK